MSASSPELVALLLGLSLAGSAFFSGCETGLMTASRVRLHRLIQAGDRRAAALQRWLGHMDDAILTCLVGTNLCNVMASAITTALLIELLGARGEWLAVIVASLALVTVGEILPKILFREYPERLTMTSLPGLRAFGILIWPVRWLLGRYARLLERLQRSSSDHESELDRASLARLLANTETDDRDRRFQRTMDRFLQLSQRRVADLMRPLATLVTVDPEVSLAGALVTAAASGFSRLPVRGTDGDLFGYLLVRDLLLAEESTQPANLMRPLLMVDAALSPYELFEELHARNAQLATVVDSTGRSLGIITLEDLIEKVTGAIADEFDQPEESP